MEMLNSTLKRKGGGLFIDIYLGCFRIPQHCCLHVNATACLTDLFIFICLIFFVLFYFLLIY